MSAYRFYRAAADEIVPRPVELAEGLTLSRWQPRRHGHPHGVFAAPVNAAWWLADGLRLFARPDLSVYAIHDGPHLLHRLLVTPRWYRFPFMAADDLQLGMLWTEPTRRGQGLARQAIAAAHRDYADSFGAMWYVVDESNAASVRLIESFGYRLYGFGERTRPLGLAPLGRFRMTRRAG